MAERLLLSSCSEQCNIFCIMHECLDMARILPKTNSLIINGAASCVRMLGISSLTLMTGRHTGRWRVARTRKQSGKRKSLYCHIQSHWNWFSAFNLLPEVQWAPSDHLSISKSQCLSQGHWQESYPVRFGSICHGQINISVCSYYRPILARGRFIDIGVYVLWYALILKLIFKGRGRGQLVI